MPKVSVIVPVFGVEKYIARCARSLFEQTLKDMEFVFVNDGTKDNSMSVLSSVIDEYPERKSQIIVHNMPCNSGLYMVRKTGISLAHGDYIAHCDSDDWTDTHMYEDMYNTAVKEGYDLVKCQYYKSDGKNHHLCKLELDGLRKRDIMSALLKYKGWNCIWDKLAKKELYHNQDFMFPASNMLEDFVLSTQLIYNSNSFGIVNKAYYYYYTNPSSICHNKNISNIKKGLEAKKNVDVILSYLSKRNELNNYKKEVVVLKQIPREISFKDLSSYKYYSYLNNIYPDNDLKALLSTFLPIKSRIVALMVYLRIYPLFCNVKNVIKTIVSTYCD